MSKSSTLTSTDHVILWQLALFLTVFPYSTNIFKKHYTIYEAVEICRARIKREELHESREFHLNYAALYCGIK